MPIRPDRIDRFITKAGDIEILHHPDPEIEKQLREHQEKARKLRDEQEQKQK